MTFSELKILLDEAYEKYNKPDFIASDPVSIPHRFEDPEDIAISGFIAAILAWGQRPVIIANATRILERMDHQPHDFLLNASPDELEPMREVVHRTLNGNDIHFLVQRLAEIYRSGETLETIFRIEPGESDMGAAITRARLHFADDRVKLARHLGDPSVGSAAKRTNMFLRWMIRQDDRGVDFGIWKNMDPSLLICPLDVHSSATARAFGLLKRRTNDWKAAMELTLNLRKFDAQDPVKYDFALFGLGVFAR